MTTTRYPRSPNIELGGMVHLGRLIDKIRLRHAGLIPDYNYFTTGFDKYLVEFLQLNPQEFERRVLEGGTDEELLQWVYAHGRRPSVEEARQWNERILTGGPKDEGTRQRFQSRLVEVAAKRGVPVTALPSASTWVDIIELDEGRM
ncbi:MAG: DUF5069 domain-containing protein [Nitrospira sp.]|nr:MAG: DUF5069 domain-containing protein [Nitrospira sp.]